MCLTACVHYSGGQAAHDACFFGTSFVMMIKLSPCANVRRGTSRSWMLPWRRTPCAWRTWCPTYRRLRQRMIKWPSPTNSFIHSSKRAPGGAWCRWFNTDVCAARDSGTDFSKKFAPREHFKFLSWPVFRLLTLHVIQNKLFNVLDDILVFFWKLRDDSQNQGKLGVRPNTVEYPETRKLRVNTPREHAPSDKSLVRSSRCTGTFRRVVCAIKDGDAVFCFSLRNNAVVIYTRLQYERNEVEKLAVVLLVGFHSLSASHGASLSHRA